MCIGMKTEPRRQTTILRDTRGDDGQVLLVLFFGMRVIEANSIGKTLT